MRIYKSNISYVSISNFNLEGRATIFELWRICLIEFFEEQGEETNSNFRSELFTIDHNQTNSQLVWLLKRDVSNVM